MSSKITEKTWSSDIEKKILQDWKVSNIYDIDATNQSNEKYFVIDTPPPYPSGRPWHIGAAAHYSQIDMIARFARLKGLKVIFPIGVDRNGIPVEIHTEKKYKIRMRNTERREFLKLCKLTLDETESEFMEILASLGLSANFSQKYQTDSSDFRAFTQATFIEMWNKGFVYLGNRPNNYCIDCGTTIADAEIIYSNIETRLVYITFYLNNSNDRIVIATTRPELLFSCQAIIVNPEDERYTEIQGKVLKIPLFNREVKIIPHHSADKDFGSGAVMICSYGDLKDVQLFRELGLPEIRSIDMNGRTTEFAGEFANLKIKEARDKIIDKLTSQGLVEKIESITHRTPLCERSKTQIEIISLEDYYLKQVDKKSELLERSKVIKFYPEMHRQILVNWINSIAIDWPISRRRFYGTEIPIWYCTECNSPNLPQPGRYYKPWEEDPPFDKCNKCNNNKFEGEKRIFDTWMDSSITPLFITKFDKDKEFFKKTYPTRVRPQGKDIVRTWLYYTILRCLYLTDQIPWDSAWIMGYGVDEKGEKMSKSKGNVIDPLPLINKYGADAFRFWSASETNLGYDFRCSELKIQGAQKFLSKLWNIGRFISNFEVIEESSKPQELNSTDKWILAELSKATEKCLEGYEELNFFIPANVLREFTWNIFAAHYIEMIKGRAYNTESVDDRKSALYTIHKCFKTILLLLEPISPFITFELWSKIYGVKEVISSQRKIPIIEKGYESFELSTQSIVKFNSDIWNKKKETLSEITNKPLSLKDPIKTKIPTELELFKDDLIVMHNIITE
ncbi:valine--tRNA ligase [Candidatus Nitrosocosmicus hydrocola]|uniref:valine--tRNA ligase n=1 Tax=Candidatus Nitrosocosmicus hydrocola TaxID=1826872 RepID=UPI000A880365|nr:valine--tRNA ligase [Candidatus Nitrosocosmicus hydrocola]